MATAENFTTAALPADLNITTHSGDSYPGQVFSDSAPCLELPERIVDPCDNADNLVSRATRKQIEHVLYAWLVSSLIGMGVMLNIVNMAVFVKQGLGDRVHLSLFSLSVADLLMLLSMCLRYVYKILPSAVTESWGHEVWIPTIISYRLLSLHTGFQLVSNFISIVIAVDRCVCVVWPLRAARAFSTRATGLLILVCSSVIFAGRIFVAFKYDMICAVISGVQMPPIKLVVPSDMYKEIPLVMDILDSFVLSSLVPALSVVITAIATTITAITLRRAAAWRDTKAGTGSTASISHKEKATTSMLIGISCVFIACVSPRVVRSLCRFLIPEFRVWGKLCSLMLLTEALLNLLLTLNSAVNFFVYFAMGSRFRQTLRQLLTCHGMSSSKKGAYIER